MATLIVRDMYVKLLVNKISDENKTRDHLMKV